MIQDVLRELHSLLEESREAADAACMDMQNLSLTSVAPPSTTNTTSNTAATSNESPTTSSAAPYPVASLDTTHDMDGCPQAHADPLSSTAAAEAAPRQRGPVSEDGSEDNSLDGDSDSILDFTTQELKPEEARRVVAATSVLRHTFTTIKGVCTCLHFCCCVGISH